MTSLKLGKLSGIVGFFFFPNTSKHKHHRLPVLWSSSFPKIYFLCSVIFTSYFYSFIQNFKKSFSSLPSPLILLLLSVYYILYLALLGRMEPLFFSDVCLFFLKKKKQLLSKSILLALSFPGSLAV